MNSWKNFFNALKSFTAVLLILVATYFTSWVMTSALIWVIFKLFRLNFELRIATGIWLVLVFIEEFIKGAKASKRLLNVRLKFLILNIESITSQLIWLKKLAVLG